MRSQDNQRWMGNGMSHDDYDSSENPLYEDDYIDVKLPNDNPKKWKELSGEVVIIKEGNKPDETHSSS